MIIDDLIRYIALYAVIALVIIWFFLDLWHEWHEMRKDKRQ